MKVIVTEVSGNFLRIKIQRGRKGTGGWHILAIFQLSLLRTATWFEGKWAQPKSSKRCGGRNSLCPPGSPGSEWTSIISSPTQPVAVQSTQLCLLRDKNSSQSLIHKCDILSLCGVHVVCLNLVLWPEHNTC